METYELVGYSAWANYLVNGDARHLDQRDINEIQAWLKEHKVSESECLGTHSDTYFGRCDGLSNPATGTCASTRLFVAKKVQPPGNKPGGLRVGSTKDGAQRHRRKGQKKDTMHATKTRHLPII